MANFVVTAGHSNTDPGAVAAGGLQRAWGAPCAAKSIRARVLLRRVAQWELLRIPASDVAQQ